ncbi:MAG: hypothetical protein JNK02_16850 [Planctomycetes bacterium]|nr:hypothetical protein [Planctomycetota bacterium]
MKLGGAKLWLTTCSLALVVLMAVVDVDRASPGPVSAVHARLAAIEGGQSCSACHGGWFTSMTEACLECHERIAEQLADRRGLHGRLEPSFAAGCASCHGEHHGESFDIVNVRSFALAGVADPLAFDHERIGWRMHGRHTELGCVACHENARADVLEAGESRFLGLSQDCASCHQDPHEGRMQIACASCHGQTAWDELFALGHERHVPLVGGHADVACRTCHGAGGAHALETLGANRRRPAGRTCAQCHDSPHARDFTAFPARMAGLGPDAGCVVCHVPEHVTWRQSAAGLTPGQHAFTGFALDAPHDAAACADCHAADEPAFQARHPGRDAAACSTCHQDPHGGQFHSGPFGTGECTACHAATAFTPHRFTAEMHARARLPLDGRHLEAQCESCHTIQTPGAPRAFRGIGATCEACHADAHRGFFEDAVREDETPPHGQCALCHTTEGFAAAAREFDHELWTGFSVAGAHAEEGCASCHPSLPRRDDAGRRFGFVEDRFGPFEGCVTCHADPHGGLFDAAGLPPQIAGRADCARCHVETSFRSLPYGFDHGTWTGFALRGGHAAASCSDCHAPVRAPEPGQRSQGAANGSACSDCHPDPHAGQFARGGDTDCARCHASNRPAFLAFDHDRDSRFRLGEQHAHLDCAACHLPFASTTGAEVVRFRPMGTECVDCHGVQEDVLIRRRRK